MIAGVLGIVAIVLTIAAVCYWIHALVNWDGKKPCTPGEDCESCPFPPCRDRNEGGTP